MLSLPKCFYRESIQKERYYLLTVGAAFFVELFHFVSVTAQGMDTAGIIRRNDQQFSFRGILFCQLDACVIFFGSVYQSLSCFRKLFADGSGQLFILTGGANGIFWQGQEQNYLIAAQMVADMQDMIVTLESLYADALADAGESFQRVEIDAKAIENTNQIAYSRRGYAKVFFKENVFPPFNESKSEAHELAERWSKSEQTLAGERKLISYHNKWYLIQAFDDLKYGYQIMKQLTKKEYERESLYYGSITGYQSLQSALNKDDAQHYGRSADGDTGYRTGNDASQHRGTNRNVHGLGENKVRRRTSSRNGARNLPGGGLDSRGENGSSVKRFSDRHIVERAKDCFGTTTDFNEAGFILSSGEMLKFTDDSHRGGRQYDHRAIGIAYGVDVDLEVNHGFNEESNKYLDSFVEMGGIRFDPGSLELDMDAGMQLSKSVPITAAQEQTIKAFVEWKQQREEMYNPSNDDFSLYREPLALHIDFGANANYALSVSSKDRVQRLSRWERGLPMPRHSRGSRPS